MSIHAAMSDYSQVQVRNVFHAIVSHHVGRSVVGGFMGIGGKEDGGVTVNGAKIVSSKSIGECIIHEMDDFAHPKVLDRYFDQLRIPGSS